MKKISVIVIALLLLALSPAYACVCGEGFNKENAEALFERADFVLIGKATSNIELNPQLEQWMNSKNKGSNVLMQVEFLLKGDMKITEQIFIFQFGSSCDQTFIFGDSYLIFGKNITKFSKAKFNYRDSKDTLSSIPPPPIPLLGNDGELELSASQKEVRFLNNKIRKYKTITTNLCSSLVEKSPYFDAAIEHLKNN